MEDLSLVAETGRVPGSRSSNRLRAEGKVPGVVYGHGTEPVPVSVEWRALRTVLASETGANSVVNLTLSGTRHLSLLRDLQRDPVRRTVTHVDFLLVNRDEVLTVDVPIVLEGEATEVLRADGLVDPALNSLTVHAKPADIPAAITIDVSGMAVGDVIRVGELKLPEGVTTSVDPEEPIVVASAASAIDLGEPGPEAEAAAAEAGEVPEGGEGEAAGGGAEGGAGEGGAGE